MASIAHPSVAGQGLAGYLDAYYRAAQNRRAEDLAGQAEQLHALQQMALTRQLNDDTAARAAIPQILAASPATATVVPGQPAVPPGLTETLTGPPVIDAEGIARGAPSMVTATPGRPAVPGITESAHTMESLAQAVGPEALAAAMRTPAGQVAIQSKGTITEAEFKRRQEVGKAREEFRARQDKAGAAFEKGDAQQGLLEQMAAIRALIPVVDPQHASGLQGRLDELSKMYVTGQKDEQERQHQNEDAPKFAAAVERFHKDGDAATLMGTLFGMRSQAFKKRADEMIGKFTTGMIHEVPTPAQKEFYGVFGTLYAEAAKRGQPIDQEALYKQALAHVPQVVPELIHQAVTGKRTLPEALNTALAGRPVPKNEYEAADRVVQETRGIPRNDPRYAGALMTVLASIQEAKRKPETDRTIRELTTMHRQYSVEIDNLRRGINKIATNVISLNTPEGKQELADLRQALSTALGQRRAVAQQLGDYGIAIPEDGGVTAPPPSTTTGADPKRALPPPPNPTREAALAEARRLMAVGHTKQSALAVMRQQGWNVE